MKKSSVIASLVLALTSTNTALADPKPLGFELGKATIEDVQNTYKTTEAGISAYTEGKMLNVDAYEVGLQDLQKVLFIFNSDGTLSVVDMTFRKTKFDELYGQLNKKYKLVKKQIPFVGNKYAEYKNGKSTVKLDAPHMSFELDVIYGQNSFFKIMNEVNNRKEQQRKDQQASML